MVGEKHEVKKKSGNKIPTTSKTKEEEKMREESCIIEGILFFYNNKTTNINVHLRVYIDIEIYVASFFFVFYLIELNTKKR